jgi:lipopolysaccharide export LptBFGC system permease protein LptF
MNVRKKWLDRMELLFAVIILLFVTVLNIRLMFSNGGLTWFILLYLPAIGFLLAATREK